MTGPIGWMVVGIALLVAGRRYGLGRRYGAAGPTHKFGVISDPPRWATILLGSPSQRIVIDDVIIEMIGLLWFLGGVSVALLALPPTAQEYKIAAAGLVASLFLGVGAATLIWGLRDLARR